MKSPAAVFYLILIVGFLSIIPKITVGENISALSQSSPFSDLAKQNFDKFGYTVIDAAVNNGFGVLMNSCVVWVSPSQADGESDSLMALQYGAFGKISFVYDGKVSKRRPGLSIFLDRIVARTLSIFGVVRPVSAVFMIALDQECERNMLSEILRSLNVSNVDLSP